MSEENGIVLMPTEWVGSYHNACNEPCDMIEGPCACGAWHHLYEWDEETIKAVLERFPRTIKILNAGLASVTKYGYTTNYRMLMRSA